MAFKVPTQAAQKNYLQQSFTFVLIIRICSAGREVANTFSLDVVPAKSC